MPLHRHLLASFFLALCPALVRADVYTVGTDPACSHATIQAAVDAAALHAGGDVIRIAAIAGGHANQAIVIDNQDLLLAGGFADCAALAPGTQRSRVAGAGAGASAAPVLRIGGSDGLVHFVTLEGLELVNGNNPGGRGGGLRVEPLRGGVAMSNLRIAGNRALSGAGIAIEGNDSHGCDDDSVVNVGANVQIEDNVADEDGGGIDVYKASLNIAGLDTALRRNTASRDGGGVHLHGIATCAGFLGVRSGSNGSGANTLIELNLAGRNGGALAVSANGTANLYSNNATLQPLLLSRNAADVGGAIHAGGGGAYFVLWDTMLIGNQASHGGGALAADDGGQITIGSARGGCATGVLCNFIAGNGSLNGVGAVALVRGGTAGESRIDIAGANVSTNSGDSLLADGCAPGTPLCSVPGSISVRNSLIVTNSANRLFIATQGAAFYCDLCTITGNHRDGSVAPLFDSNGALTLRRGIVWQPGSEIVGGQTPSLLNAGAMLLHDASDFPLGSGISDIRVADPHFVNAGNGDYRLAADSPALDSASSAGAQAFDVGGYRRAIDQPGVPNHNGVLDLGAWERGWDSDVIFVHGLE